MLYPFAKPQESGHLERAHGQRIYWEALGSPEGEPIVMLHGGPGAGCSAMSRRFFDLNKYRVILWDQRGCARSATPVDSMSPLEVMREREQMLKHLSFENMVEDMDALRAHLGIERWSVFGGSWGTTLALGYAQAFPDRVKRMLLRGVFTSSKEEIDWLYSEVGAAQMFPIEWVRFYTDFLSLASALRHQIKASPGELESREILGVFEKAFLSEDPQLQTRAALAWGQWEQSIMSLQGAAEVSPADHQRNFEMGLISCHLFLHDPVLLGRQLWSNLPLIASMPCDIVQGQFDAVTPAKTAWVLSQKMKNCRLQLIRQAGHASSDPELTRALVRVLDNWTF